MDIQGLEQVNLGEIKELYKLDKMTIKEAIPLIREFRDKHGLTDRQTKTAFSVSKKIFDV